jgi:glucosamine kinase
MILIADSGSTKTEWVLLNNKQTIAEVYTQGINPYFQGEEQVAMIVKEELLPSFASIDLSSIKQIFYYGAGCSTPDKCATVQRPLEQAFQHAVVSVSHDLLAAARAACGTEKGITAILGTGSNSCLFDGTEITANQPSLGFIMGDEGSGGYMGKELLKQFLYSELDETLHASFLNKYPINKEIVLEQVYKKPMPNRYAASFVPFIAQHLQHPQMQELVKDAFAVFFGRHIASYEAFTTYPLSAVGSVAFVFRTQLEEVAKQYSVTLKQVIQKPMEGLIAYHS